MKKCRSCKVEKPPENFHWKIKGKTRHTICKDCHKIYNRSHYQKNKDRYCPVYVARKRERREKLRLWAMEYLNAHPCVDCGETDPILLDFDHCRGEKSFGISKAINGGYSKKRLLEEVKKCDVRCTKCHRRKTASENGYYRHRHLGSIPSGFAKDDE